MERLRNLTDVIRYFEYVEASLLEMARVADIKEQNGKNG